MSHNDTPVNAHLNELLFTVGIGTWDWELNTGKVIYSDAWAKTQDYEPTELLPMVETWERMVLPKDLSYANAQIQRHLSGEDPIYEAEFRMLCKDGSVIWAQDKGRVTEYDKDGKPLRFMEVLQNVTRLKETESRLLKNQETLDLAVDVTELGIWDWDIAANTIRYNDEYLSMLGYSLEDITGSMNEWMNMNHPDDRSHALQLLDTYIAATDNEMFQLLGGQGIQSIFHCASKKDDVIQVMIGFDDCTNKRIRADKEIATLLYVSKILVLHLMHHRANRTLGKLYWCRNMMLENMGAFIYATDVETKKILYCNEMVRQWVPGVECGNTCHKAAFGCDTPCRVCPANQLTADRKSVTEEIWNPRFNLLTLATVTSAEWDGVENAALVACADITKYKAPVCDQKFNKTMRKEPKYV